MYWSLGFNLLFIAAFFVDRYYRIKSLNVIDKAHAAELKAKEAVVVAKDATIESLKMQLEASEKNNDVSITEMHKKRVESIKMIVDDQEKVIADLKSKISKSTQNNVSIEEMLNELLDLTEKSNQETKKAIEGLSKPTAMAIPMFQSVL